MCMLEYLDVRLEGAMACKNSERRLILDGAD